jgi:hypothetical protein
MHLAVVLLKEEQAASREECSVERLINWSAVAECPDCLTALV